MLRSPAIPQNANALREFPVGARQSIDDQITAPSRCYMRFDKRVRSDPTAQTRQQAGSSGKTESTDGLQTRRHGPRHEAVGW
jgi:hypothetical protein